MHSRCRHSSGKNFLARDYGLLRLPAPRPDRLLFGCRSVPPACSHFCSERAPKHCTRQPGELRVRLLRMPFALLESTGPPRFLENPNVSMPCSSTSVRRCVPGFYSTTIRPSVVLKTSALTTRHFAAPSHGLLTRCLRFTQSVTRLRARLASGWQPTFSGWASPHWVPLHNFRNLHCFPSAQAFLAHQDLTPTLPFNSKGSPCLTLIFRKSAYNTLLGQRRINRRGERASNMIFPERTRKPTATDSPKLGS